MLTQQAHPIAYSLPLLTLLLRDLARAAAAQMLPPEAYPAAPVSSLTTKFAAASANRTRCTVNTITWTPDARRAMSGDNIGQLTMWGGQDFKCEQLYQASVGHPALRARWLTRERAQACAHAHMHARALRSAHLHTCSLCTPAHVQSQCAQRVDATLRTHNARRTPRAPQAHDKGLRHAAFSHNGAFLFSCDDAGVVRIFKSNLAPLSKLSAHTEAVRALAVAPSDVKFASASDDGTIKLWDLATTSLEKTLTGARRARLCLGRGGMSGCERAPRACAHTHVHVRLYMHVCAYTCKWLRPQFTCVLGLSIAALRHALAVCCADCAHPVTPLRTAHSSHACIAAPLPLRPQATAVTCALPTGTLSRRCWRAPAGTAW